MDADTSNLIDELTWRIERQVTQQINGESFDEIRTRIDETLADYERRDTLSDYSAAHKAVLLDVQRRIADGSLVRIEPEPSALDPMDATSKMFR